MQYRDCVQLSNGNHLSWGKDTHYGQFYMLHDELGNLIENVEHIHGSSELAIQKFFSDEDFMAWYIGDSDVLPDGVFGPALPPYIDPAKSWDWVVVVEEWGMEAQAGFVKPGKVMEAAYEYIDNDDEIVISGLDKNGKTFWAVVDTYGCEYIRYTMMRTFDANTLIDGYPW